METKATRAERCGVAGAAAASTRPFRLNPLSFDVDGRAMNSAPRIEATCPFRWLASSPAASAGHTQQQPPLRTRTSQKKRRWSATRKESRRRRRRRAGKKRKLARRKTRTPGHRPGRRATASIQVARLSRRAELPPPPSEPRRPHLSSRSRSRLVNVIAVITHTHTHTHTHRHTALLPDAAAGCVAVAMNSIKLNSLFVEAVLNVGQVFSRLSSCQQKWKCRPER